MTDVVYDSATFVAPADAVAGLDAPVDAQALPAVALAPFASAVIDSAFARSNDAEPAVVAAVELVVVVVVVGSAPAGDVLAPRLAAWAVRCSSVRRACRQDALLDPLGPAPNKRKQDLFQCWGLVNPRLHECVL